MVKKPAWVRYAWAVSPMGNLKVDGKAWAPLHSFRTDELDWPEEGPEVTAVSRGDMKINNEDAAERLEFRRSEEAKIAVEILERLKTLGSVE